CRECRGDARDPALPDRLARRRGAADPAHPGRRCLGSCRGGVVRRAGAVARRRAHGQPRPAGPAPRVTLLVAIVGATGTGKSELSLDLAERLADAGTPAEIVNADAMQLYRGMDIGTAKLAPGERRGIPHHLIDVVEPTEEASVARYQVEARAAIDDILTRGRVPILVGGSGLYVSSVLYDFRFPGTDDSIRSRLETELAEHGAGALFERLRERDPAAATAIGPHNGRRIVRALEVIELTGEPFGSGLPEESGTWRPNVTIGLRLDRERLVPRLDARV